MSKRNRYPEGSIYNYTGKSYKHPYRRRPLKRFIWFLRTISYNAAGVIGLLLFITIVGLLIKAVM